MISFNVTIKFDLKLCSFSFNIVSQQRKNLSRQDFVYAPVDLCHDIEKSCCDMISKAHVFCSSRHKEIMSRQTLSL